MSINESHKKFPSIVSWTPSPSQDTNPSDNAVNQQSLNTDILSINDYTTDKTFQSKQYQKFIWNNEYYEGSTVLGNIHGTGFYFTEKNAQQIFYDGLFYLNNLEGYSQVFYENGDHFQGLFKSNKRYGPGVLTYVDGNQDVGFWHGFRLMRLISVVGHDLVPTLAQSSIGRTKLLNYRYLINLEEETRSYIHNILSEDTTMEQLNVLFNRNIRNQRSVFFDKDFFDKNFFIKDFYQIDVSGENDDYVAEEEQPDGSYNENIFHDTILNVIKKIEEIKQYLSSIRYVKQYLMETIYNCTECCVREYTQSEQSSEISQITNIEAENIHDKITQSDKNSRSKTHSLSFSPTQQDTSSNGAESITIEELCQCVCDEEMKTDDNIQKLEDQLYYVKRQEIFYKNICNNLQTKLDRLVTWNYNSGTKNTRINEILAWNNEQILIDIQRHCFKHRNSEYMVNFDVTKLIRRKRSEFQQPGKYENICRKFLLSCANGHKSFVSRNLRENINPNLTDARGNSGIFFAAVQNRNQILPLLAYYGAKLDQINDEGLTPLSLCLLKYIAIQNKCSSWETSFIPECELIDTSDISDLSLNTIIMVASQSATQSNSSVTTMNFSNPKLQKLYQKLNNSTSVKPNIVSCNLQDTFLFDLSYRDKQVKTVQVPVDAEVESCLKSTEIMILMLLEYGVDPNIADVPYPPLTISLFTRNTRLVKQILESNANVNIVITKDCLSPLHVLASLIPSENNVEIFRLLLKYKCNPNLKTAPSHWKEQKLLLIGDTINNNNLEIEDSGKNALHMICMRNDFDLDKSNSFCDISNLLLEFGIDYECTYLGHTVLSLAVLLGNIKLIQCLIKTNLYNPYQLLAYGMGNIITLHCLKRFEKNLPVEQCKTILVALFEMDVNFLNPVGNSENVIAFLEENDTLTKNLDAKKSGGKPSKKENKSSKKTEKSKSNRSTKNTKEFILKEFLEDLSRETIVKQIQMFSTHALYDFAEDSVIDQELKAAVILAEFLTPSIGLINLETLFRYGKIDHERFDRGLCKIELEFIEKYQPKISIKQKKLQSKDNKSKKSPKVKAEDVPLPTTDIEDLLSKFKLDTNDLSSTSRFVIKPGLDDPKQYKICFQCLKGKGKDLIACPRCQLIYFCSVQCNKLSNKLKTLHKCNLIFYDSRKDKSSRNEGSENKSLMDVVETIRNNCVRRLQLKRKKQLEIKRQEILDMWKLDTYGTNAMQYKYLIEQLNETADGLSPKLMLLSELLKRNIKNPSGHFTMYSMNTLMTKELQSEFIRSLSITSGMMENCFKEIGVLDDVDTNKRISPKIISESLRSIPNKLTSKHEKESEELIIETKQKLISLPGIINTNKENSAGNKSTSIKRKLRKIPERYRKFIEIFATYFPDVDFAFELLPYVCYNDGRLYYKFCDKNEEKAVKGCYSFL